MQKLDETNPYRNSNNVLLLRGLFVEHARDPAAALYTLQNHDHAGKPSLYRLYMEAADPTEYTFAVGHLDGWEHWELLCSSSFFQPYVARWRRELELLLRSEALAKIIRTSQGTSKDAFAAAKFITTGGYTNKDTNPRGRPTKADITREAYQIAEDRKRLTDDFERLTTEGSA